jgi:hypothetical protein
MTSLKFLSFIHYAAMALCWLIGTVATSVAIQLTAGLAFVVVWLAREIVEALCAPAR